MDVKSALGHQIQTPSPTRKHQMAVTESECDRKAPMSVNGCDRATMIAYHL